MSAPYPRSWDVGARADTEPDEALCRVWDALDEDGDFDRVEEVVNPLLDVLVEAGYVEQWGHSDSGCFWAIAPAGHKRLQALGRDAAEDPS